MFADAVFILSSIEESISPKHHAFLRDEKLGYVTPTEIGNAFICYAEVSFECLEVFIDTTLTN